MDIDKIELLLIEAIHILNNYDKIFISSGNNFNIFNILKLETSEVRLHSAILSDLLNSKGSHGQRDLFLKLFVEHFNINDFATDSAVSISEYNIGPINIEYTKGGQIDILITNKEGRHIIIENKINAIDQKKQLLRYYNFDPKAYIFYLNLNGVYKFHDDDKALQENEKLMVISYTDDILSWLDKCVKEAFSLPIIRETLNQYITLLKKLTNQSNISEMNEEIKKLIEKNLDYIKSIEDCYRVLQTVILETKSEFEKELNKFLPRQTIYSENGISIDVYWREDGDGVYIGYVLQRDGKNISDTEIAKDFITLFKEIKPNGITNNWHLLWYNPTPFSRHMKFENLDKKFIFEMNTDNNKLKELVNKIVAEEKEIRYEFIKRLNSMS